MTFTIRTYEELGFSEEFRGRVSKGRPSSVHALNPLLSGAIALFQTHPNNWFFYFLMPMLFTFPKQDPTIAGRRSHDLRGINSRRKDPGDVVRTGRNLAESRELLAEFGRYQQPAKTTDSGLLTRS